MTRKTLNVIIGIVFAFIVVFFAGSFAYETYSNIKSDERYEQSLKEDTENLEKENQSGATNEEAKNN